MLAAVVNLLFYYVLKLKFKSAEQRDDSIVTLVLVDAFLFMVLAIYLDVDSSLCLCCMTMLMFSLKVLNSDEVFSGFSNIGIATALFLYIVAGGLKETHIFDDIAKRYLIKLNSETKINWALFPVVLVLSSITPN